MADEPETHEGRCFCGETRIAVHGPAALQGWCHCDDCRAWSGALATPYAIWPGERVEIRAGEAGLLTALRDGRAERVSCGRCGGSVAARIRGGEMVDVFPGLLPDFGFEPASHIFYAKRRIDMPDGLPKFLDMPAPAGGSGEMQEA